MPYRSKHVHHRSAMDNVVDEQNQIIINELKATIIALRVRLEEADFEKKKVEQKVNLIAADEIQQLKNTASVLRNELEKF